MIRIVADSLEDAYKKASDELGLSVVELEIEVLQAPSSGFLGLFKKKAIITAKSNNEINKRAKSDLETDKKRSIALDEIESGIRDLLKNSCFSIELKEINSFDDEIYIKLDGEDAALLIGKEGYRYKALSYMLHNWIKIKYDKNISLEIGEFLKNQNEMIDNYLLTVKERVQEQGYASTKALDGILIKLALNKLRESYPDKYVAIKTTRDGRKKIVVNEFYRSRE
jgi:spoIIIJ-associated protein